MSPVTGVSFGIHFSKEEMDYRKNGFLIHQKSHGAGVQGSVLGVRAAIGLRHGYEISDVKTFEEGQLTVQEQFEHKFSGQLTLSGSAGDRGG